MSRAPTALWFWPDTSGDDTVRFTDKQKEVFDLICRGYSYKEIAFMLGIAEVTVKQRMATIRKNLGAKNNTHALKITVILSF
ncbi:helix-turn-helix transcriptional regulator [Hellea sp.]|nr:helix-turn-helix transcriptional regulator [Hellea sp.]